MATVPTVPEFTSGVLTSTQLNQLSDAVSYALMPPLAKLKQTSVQTLTTSVWTSIALDTEDADTDIDGTGGHDNVTNNSRYTARYPGWYQASGGVAFAGNTTGRRGVRFAVNGSLVDASGTVIIATSPSAVTMPASADHIYLNAGDYLEIQGLQESGGNLNTAASASESRPRMTVRWVSN